MSKQNHLSGTLPRLRTALPALAALLVAPLALAQFTVTFVASFHGGPCTEYSAWESFTQANNAPNSPDDPTTTSPDSAVLQLTPGGIITPAGNLDNLVSPPTYRITDDVPSDLQEVVLQVSMHLNPVDWSSFALSYTDSGGQPQSLPPTTSTYLVHQMGHDERVITWDLSAIADSILSYRIDFVASNPSTTLDAVKLDTRFTCGGGVPFCAGDGLDPSVTVACPCGNFGALGRGCANSINSAGAELASTGTAANDDIVLLGSGMPATVTCVYLQGDAFTAASFGDGVRCVDGVLLRLRARANVGGASAFPDASDTVTLSVRGGVVPGSGVTRYYQTQYRNASAAFCPPATFNITNGLRVVW